MKINNKKVVIVGAGAVGSTYAHNLVVDDLADEIAIINTNKSKASANSLDLLHALPYLNAAPKNIYAADYSDVSDADIVVVSANAPSATFGKNPDRLQLLENNVEMIRDITRKTMDAGFDGIFLVASNPVDVLAQVVAEVSGLPKHRVIGTGTLLETSRMRQIVAEKLQINPKSIHGYVLAEHGKSSFAAWSNVTVGAIPLTTWLKKYPNPEFPTFDEIDQEIREVGLDIFMQKGNTSYGIAASLARLTRAIFRNESVILPVSAYLTGEYGQSDLYTGSPAIIDRTGVRAVLELELSQEEQEKFKASTVLLKENFDSIKEKCTL
ncbi:L-lactate dehydrogenase [Lactococcus lactis]|uniref:L-lactate dehydrogenase n=1 Tax=Lactococcus lactis TaxID=1358 RepID=A0AAP8E1T5_9LACT|nr:L-lactate dehydrogenase [Lactococcus lactis]MCZ8489969.1 L-lactate dehydrogenase [Lactococcus lactis]MDG4970365.1 L-lactate dehydrogenase [Lactococcus lactis]PFG89316.1 L-lactate dehydrogenase [Lactococcus lactis]QEA60501.1 L-lactate dehydrogenase [Lactococcus lactis]QQF01142.1 L-lactate dehydrogenase [Lactococcus lactis]